MVSFVAVMQEHHSPFIKRHIGIDDASAKAMLQALNIDSIDQLISQTIPSSIINKNLPLEQGVEPTEALQELAVMAAKNILCKNYIGQGYHPCHTPAIIRQNILQNPSWYSAYTPYQPEISQGRLEMLLNFQHMVSDLTGMDMANASLLDEGTAAAEAMTMAHRLCKDDRNQIFLDSLCYDHVKKVVRTRAKYLGIEVVEGKTYHTSEHTYAAILAHTKANGEIANLNQTIKELADKNILSIVTTDLLALCATEPPANADIMVGNSQRFGIPLFFGGPHAAFFACKEAYKRSMPGRLIGVSKDILGKTAYRMALQTREQHIRREKATSNICTAQALLAIGAAGFAIYHGQSGLREIARRVHQFTTNLAHGLKKSGYSLESDTWFDTITIKVNDAALIKQRATDRKINFYYYQDSVAVSINETTTAEDLLIIAQIFDATISTDNTSNLPPRNSSFLTHPNFSHQNENNFTRYIHKLERRDLALNNAMIPLGSCTMKLNSPSQLEPIFWKEFANIHPLAPDEQTHGYQELIASLSQSLAICGGYDEVWVQPNSGAQGEYAGLIAIREYHIAQGQQERTLCFIPKSAHGTNPASAILAGMQIISIACDSQGSICMQDLTSKLEKYKDNLAAMMITYPSTHGVFEEHIQAICNAVHQAGGQIYIDGANLNAMIGLVKMGELGGDISHFNLHKTFAIPHGGGGPGVGPIGYKNHLTPFIPKKEDQICSATFGSAGILPISWMYIRSLGKDIVASTKIAILSANYIANALKDDFPLLYTNNNGLVAHECILDLRPLKKTAGITEEDVCKRLIDYNFHAPTVSFPVAGTLMIEPTESEPLKELDRFIAAMRSIKKEIEEIISGAINVEDSPLKRAPHNLESILGKLPYSIDKAICYHQDKYFPPVTRIDHVAGDKNLLCSCPSMEDYTDE